MGSSSSRRNYTDYSTPDILSKIRQADGENKSIQYEVDVNAHLDQVLSNFNSRDSRAISSEIDSIKNALGEEIEGTVSTRFGGSLSKNTHVSGLSDIDTLVILNNTELADKPPAKVLNYFFKILKKEYGDENVRKGDMSVTVTFDEGDLQLLPAIKYKTGVKIPDGLEWSGVVKPTLFARRLTVLNQKLNGKLIPVIKIIKGINSQFPDKVKLKGYHIEALALQIFEPKVVASPTIKSKDLIVSFFSEASDLVKHQIKDISKQNQYVDDYLGKKSDIRRVLAAEVLNRTFRKLELADSGKLTEVWKEIIPNEQ
jgi:hypothetical protein